MEFRARYTLIGVFSLAIFAGIFAFVYWINTAEGFQQRDYYKIRFENSVSGLVRGGRVLFNGIHIGEVSALELDFDQPTKLFATIAIEQGTPIRSDTFIGLEYQSLTGGASIALSGRGTTAPLLKSTGSDIPLLIADPSVGLSWTQYATVVLKKLDGILTENAKPLNGSIVNIKTFTDVLSKNSERIENILAGLETFVGGAAGKKKAVIYDLVLARGDSPTIQNVTWQLVVSEPTVQLAFNTDKVMIKAKAGEITTFEHGRWGDNLPNFFQTKVLQSFENAGYANAISKPSAGAASDYQLVIDIRFFHLSKLDSPQAEIIFNAKLIDGDGKIIKSQLFTAYAPASDANISAATFALSEAFKKSMMELIKWTVNAI